LDEIDVSASNVKDMVPSAGAVASFTRTASVSLETTQFTRLTSHWNLPIAIPILSPLNTQFVIVPISFAISVIA